MARRHDAHCGWCWFEWHGGAGPPDDVGCARVAGMGPIRLQYHTARSPKNRQNVNSGIPRSPRMHGFGCIFPGTILVDVTAILARAGQIPHTTRRRPWLARLGRLAQWCSCKMAKATAPHSSLVQPISDPRDRFTANGSSGSSCLLPPAGGAHGGGDALSRQTARWYPQSRPSNVRSKA